MKRGIVLHLEDQGKRGDIYSIRFQDEDQSELRKFLDNPDFQETKAYRRIISWLDLMQNKYGFRDSMFRPESQYWNSVMALPRDKGAELRMYCCRWGESVLIVGSSGFKSEDQYQADRALLSMVRVMEQLDEQLSERIKSKEVIAGQFEGLEFEVEA